MHLQAVVADAAVVRMAGADATPNSVTAFQRDMPRAVPLGRWDADAPQHARHGARFSGFIDGELVEMCANKDGKIQTDALGTQSCKAKGSAYSVRGFLEGGRMACSCVKVLKFSHSVLTR